MTTALLTHPDCLGHVNPPGHPEQVARLVRVLEALDAPDFAGLRREAAPLASDAALLRVHPAPYLARLAARVPAEGYAAIDGDTFLMPQTLTAARRAAGAVVRAVDMVMAGEVRNAFCAVRPPGHHAETGTAMGFCYFGSVVAGARHALEAHGLARVAIVDFDVHHGNGTQDLVWEDARILFASTHQMPLYPEPEVPMSAAPTARSSTCRWRRGRRARPSAPPWNATCCRRSRRTGRSSSSSPPVSMPMPATRSPILPCARKTSPGSPMRSATPPTAMPAAASSQLWRADMIWGRSPRRLRRMCGC